MLNHPTLDRLQDLGLHGMVKGFRDLAANPESKALEHTEWLGILVEREITLRQQKRFESRARTAKLRHLAAVEDVDYRAARGLDRALFIKLAGCEWIRERHHCLMTGPTGVANPGWPAHSATRRAARTSRCSTSACHGCSPPWRWLAATGLAKLMRQFARVDLLILDDWGPEPLFPEQQRDLLEIVEDRYGAGSLIITSQLPVDRWYEIVGNPTLADAILDRVVHNAHRIELSGESLRKPRTAA